MSTTKGKTMSRESEIRRKARAYRDMYHDGGEGYTPYGEDAIRAARRADQLDEWTVETTQVRRESWNARVRSGEFSDDSGKIVGRLIAAAGRDQGWSFADLKSAIDRHGL